MLLPCAATCPSVVARAAAVARGAIAGASVLLSSFEASSAVTLSSRDWMAAALLPEAAVFTARRVKARASCPAVTCVPSVTSPLSRTSGILPVTGPSNMFTYVLAALPSVLEPTPGPRQARTAPGPHQGIFGSSAATM